MKGEFGKSGAAPVFLILEVVKDGIEEVMKVLVLFWVLRQPYAYMSEDVEANLVDLALHILLNLHDWASFADQVSYEAIVTLRHILSVLQCDIL